MLKIKLSRDLRRDLLRGNPWVYHEALETPSTIPSRAQLCQVLDKKQAFLGWGVYDPAGTIGLRMLSTERKPFDFPELCLRIQKAQQIRENLLTEATNSYRLLNGEGDHVPGLVCDIYARTAVVQFDGQGPEEFWRNYDFPSYLIEQGICESVVHKGRGREDGTFSTLAGPEPGPEALILENSVQFKVDLKEGQKTGFFLDQRNNRRYLKSLCKNKSVLNVFSYTGGFSVYAGVGGAKQVASLDISGRALDLAQENWILNQLDPALHQCLKGDAFKVIQELNALYDIVVVDPPSMAHAENQKAAAVQKYADIFQLAARVVKPGGDLILSSCSSHIQFEDFYEIITLALSKARRTGQILRVSGQGEDHPFPHSLREMQYLKFVHLKLS